MKRNILISLGLAISLCFLGLGCEEDEDDNPMVAANSADCMGCHTSQTMLQATVAPDTSEVQENPGEG